MPSKKAQNKQEVEEFNKRRRTAGKLALRLGCPIIAKASKLSLKTIYYWKNKCQDITFHPMQHGGRR